jgi:uncharacterized protein YbbK (DUF523 family)
LEALWDQVVRYFGEDERRIEHARRVLEYATWILEADGAERKYGSTAGSYQELEGPVIDHVSRIVGSHHSPGEVTTPEFLVIWDADWLVNLPDVFPGMGTERLEKVIGKVFKTRLGRLLARRMFLGETAPALTLVSGCLAGQKCRYDGGDCLIEGLRELAARGEGVPVCPERLGGLPAPRGPAEIVGGTGADVLDGKARVLDCAGVDLTGAFVAGAHEALELARALGIRRAVLKEFSPSCGSGRIYDGTFTRVRIPGEGVLAALLRREGIVVEAGGRGA